MSIDIKRCIKASKNILITGNPIGTERSKAIEDAIIAIQTNGATALTGSYIGVKNYAAFGDQRSDHSYGMGPSHGSIVFSIGRTNSANMRDKPVLGENEIYYLQCYRDFRNMHYNGFKIITLSEALELYSNAETTLDALTDLFDKAEVELG